MIDFNRLQEEFNTRSIPESSVLPREDEGAIYVLYSIFHRLDCESIDFSRFTDADCENAKESFNDSVCFEDEDEFVHFDRDSSWAAVSFIANITWNYNKSLPNMKRVQPPFPLI
ncbi:hypothetical protein [Planococcus lenghuensis]|uniref:Uncharacterized protein n=1 Tax=Planococcus lenghuensis TaxID=2213202 RepID=A0A1Q2L4J6_9BACL|nr:hypothetical protein [Planococcus lenghuensis]AQQ55331.1 hypothetical protein B0X71_19345 [Planococcus lenghuensis]